MKLAIIVTEFPKSTETFIYRDLTMMIALGHEVRLYYVAPFRRNQTLHSFAEPLRERAVWIGFAGFAALIALARALLTRPVTLVRTVAQIVRAYARHPKILVRSLALLPKALAIAADAKAWGAEHVHAEFAGHPATTAWIGRRMGGLPYSVSCRAHDIFRTQKLLDKKLGEAMAIRTVSQFGADFLRRNVSAIAQRDIRVIHSSIDTAAIAPVETVPATSPLRILYVGALEPKKGVEYLIDALIACSDRLGDWQCHLIGGGPSEAALKARAAPLGERMQFLGIQRFEEVVRYYNQASLCVAPSIIGPDGRQEGIPNVMIEALAYQRPAITTAISGIPELITNGVSGWLVPPGDATALGDAILEIVCDPAAALERARKGRAHVEAEFDLTANVQRQLAMMAGETAQ